MKIEKFVPREMLGEKVKALKAQGKTIVTLNGSFDLFHAGHLVILEEAKEQGDVLIVALNSDASIKQYKGPDRPLIPLKDRLKLMSALECVDIVTSFDETNPCAILEIIQPNVHVNGSDYGEDCIEAPTVKKYGGRIHIVSRIADLSTSEIIKKIVTTCV